MTFSASFDLATLAAGNGSDGFVLNGISAGDQSGRSIASAGDVNGDGFDDLIIGAPNATPGLGRDRGEAYVVFGAAESSGASLDLAQLDGTDGFRLAGIDLFDRNGTAVAGAGDINGDGFDDLIVGAPGADPDGTDRAGESYVVFGTAEDFGSSFDLATLDGSNGFRLDGGSLGDLSGSAVAGVGDINGDGIDDLIVGTSVVFGSTESFDPSIDLTALDGSNGFRLEGDYGGTSIAGAGDVNGDGFDDLIIGATGANREGLNSAGASYVVFGAAQGFGASFDLAALDGSNGFRLDGIEAGDRSGASVAGAGDVNGDGFDDLIIGAGSADPDGNVRAGQSYVVFGAAQGFSASFNLVTAFGSSGLRLNGVDAGDVSGSAVAGAGDINADGFDDLIIGAPDAANRAGESYVVFGAAQGLGSPFDLASLDGFNGFVLDGIDPGDFSGTSVAGAGDVNGDGIDDLFISAVGADPNGNERAGESYLVFGRPTVAPIITSPATFFIAEGQSAVTTVTVTDPDTNPSDLTFSVDGGADQDLFTIDRSTGALSFREEPDFENPTDAGGDNDYEVVVGVSDTVNTTTQAVTVRVGDIDETANFAASLDLAALDGSNGFRLDGIDAGDRSGASVAAAGDVNGDGIADLIIGAVGAGVTGSDPAGESYIVFGSTLGFNANVDLATLDGTDGFVINGIDDGDRSGASVAAAGDVNGDGIDDFIVGAERAAANGEVAAGESYVVFGSTEGFGASFDLGALDGSNGFRLDGIDAFDFSGRSVSGAGDVNGDGFDDLIIGADGGDPDGETSAGESYVVFGAGDGFGPSFDLGTLDGSNGFRLDGIETLDRSGNSVARAGDVNADGFDDLIIAATNQTLATRRDGESYVVFGAAEGFGDRLDLAALDGVNGFRVEGFEAGFSARSVSGAGDINGDGIEDLIIGVAGANVVDTASGFEAGKSYVVFGSAQGFGSTLDLDALDGTDGFVVNGVDRRDGSGGSVAGAGDVNGDGVDDLIIGARGADPGRAAGAGESYVVFGSPRGFGASLDLDALDGISGFRLDGVDASDASGSAVAGAGDVNGDGIDDLLVGAPGADPDGEEAAGASYVVFGRGPAPIVGGDGDDTLTGGARNDTIDGGAGNDVLNGGAGNDTLNGGAGDDTLEGGLGDDQLTGGGSDRNLFLTGQGNDRITDFDIDGGDERSFDTLVVDAFGTTTSLTTARSLLDFVGVLSTDDDASTGTVVEGDDLVLILARRSGDADGALVTSVRLEGVIGDGALTRDALIDAGAEVADALI